MGSGGRVPRLASSASMAVKWVWTGRQAAEPGQVRARLAARSRRVRSSSPGEARGWRVTPAAARNGSRGTPGPQRLNSAAGGLKIDPCPYGASVRADGPAPFAGQFVNYV